MQQQAPLLHTLIQTLQRQPHMSLTLGCMRARSWQTEIKHADVFAMIAAAGPSMLCFRITASKPVHAGVAPQFM